MTAKQLIAGMVFGLSLISASAQPVNLEQNKVFVQKSQRDANTALTLSTTDKDVLVQHLADKYNKPVTLVKRIVHSAFTEANLFGFPPLLVLAMIEKESGLKADVVNKYGAVGLMQVVPRYHMEKMDGKPASQLKIPEFNIKVGLEVLSESVSNAGGQLHKGLKQFSGGAVNYEKKVFKLKKDLELVVQQSRSSGLDS